MYFCECVVCACKRMCVDSCVYRITVYKKEKKMKKKISLDYVEIPKRSGCRGFMAAFSHVHRTGSQVHLIPSKHCVLAQ